MGQGQHFSTCARAEAWPAGDPSIGWHGAVQKRRAQLDCSKAPSTGAWENESTLDQCLGKWDAGPAGAAEAGFGSDRDLPVTLLVKPKLPNLTKPKSGIYR